MFWDMFSIDTLLLCREKQSGPVYLWQPEHTEVNTLVFEWQLLFQILLFLFLYWYFSRHCVTHVLISTFFIWICVVTGKELFLIARKWGVKSNVILWTHHGKLTGTKSIAQKMSNWNRKLWSGFFVEWWCQGVWSWFVLVASLWRPCGEVDTPRDRMRWLSKLPCLVVCMTVCHLCKWLHAWYNGVESICVLAVRSLDWKHQGFSHTHQYEQNPDRISQQIHFIWCWLYNPIISALLFTVFH